MFLLPDDVLRTVFGLYFKRKAHGRVLLNQGEIWKIK